MKVRCALQSSGRFGRGSLALLRLEDLVHDFSPDGNHRAQFTPVDDLGPAVRQARLDGLPGRTRGLGCGCGRRRRRGVHGGRPLQVTDLLLQRVDLHPLGWLLT
jgi:hypothetical protein